MMHKSAYFCLVYPDLDRSPNDFGQLDPVQDPGGQNDTQKYKSEEISCFEVLNVLLGELLLVELGRPSWRPGIRNKQF
jgi:hypothetical protein